MAPAAVWSGPPRGPRPRPRAVRPVADQYVSRSAAGDWPDRAPGSSTAPSTGRASSPISNRSSCPPCIPGTSSSPITSAHTKWPASARRSSASAPRSAICRPTVRTSIPLNSASRSSKPSCAPPAVDPPKPSGLSSAPVCRTSAPRNAAITFDTAAIRAPHGHEKRFRVLKKLSIAALSQQLARLLID